MYQTITMKQLEEYLDCSKDMMLLDVRNRSSFQACHLRDAVNIPYEELEMNLTDIPDDRLIICYCARGGHSMLACNHLSALGYHVINVANGLSCYRGKYLIKP